MAKDLKSTVFKMMEQDVIKEKRLASKEEAKDVSKKDKKSGTSYVVSSINNNIKVKSYQSNSKVITYVFQLKTKCDKIIITYQVNDKIAFAYGLLEYIKYKNENSIINLIG